jgi:hypothetical protein
MRERKASRVSRSLIWPSEMQYSNETSTWAFLSPQWSRVPDLIEGNDRSFPVSCGTREIG